MRPFVLSLAAAAILSAGDPYCPKYPPQARTEMEESLSLDRELQAYSPSTRARPAVAAPRSHLAASSNFIDQLMPKKTSTERVEPAPRASDAAVLPRIYLDLTGR